MSVAVDLRHRLGAFTLDARFEAPGGVTAVFGPSGSGKTTLVNAVAGLIAPDAGRIEVAGACLLDTARGLSVPRHRRGVGYVFQDARLFPHMTVARNIAFGGRFAAGRPAAADPSAVIDLLGIGPLMDRRPGALSGGEAQRVAIARALLSCPRLLILDEPLAALDQARREEILPYLERIRDRMGLPMLYVSHAIGEVARLASTVVLMRDGRVERTGPPGEVFADPAFGPAGAGGVGGGVLTARVLRHDASDHLTELALSGGRLFVPLVAAAPGTDLRLRIGAGDILIARTRPEGLSALNVLPVTVRSVVPGPGAACAVVIEAGTDRLLATLTHRSVRALDLAPGVACFAILKTMRVGSGDIGTSSDSV